MGVDVGEMGKGNMRVGGGDCEREHGGGMGVGEIVKGSMGKMGEESIGKASGKTTIVNCAI